MTEKCMKVLIIGALLIYVPAIAFCFYPTDWGVLSIFLGFSLSLAYLVISFKKYIKKDKKEKKFKWLGDEFLDKYDY